MEISATALILVGVICVVLGFIASMLLGTLRDETEEPAAPEAEAPPGGQKGRYIAVARLWRERNSNMLVVEMDGKGLVTPEPLKEQERARLEQIARDLRAWLGMGLAEPAAISAAPAAAPESDLRSAWSVELADDDQVQGAAGVLQEATAAQAAVTQPPVQASRPQANRPAVKPAARSGKPAADEPAAVVPTAGKSMVMQIEDILQDMLAGSPLRKRGIHLMEDPIRGVIVSLDGEMYEGIEGVPDEEVKAFIRSAVAAWDEGQ
jgi:hypothetical protein